MEDRKEREREEDKEKATTISPHVKTYTHIRVGEMQATQTYVVTKEEHTSLRGSFGNK